MPTDNTLLQIIDAALLDTAQKSGPWLVCKQGCSQCCTGAFVINALDSERLRRGFVTLQKDDPERATRVVDRVTAYIERTQSTFPGDTTTGTIGEDSGSQLAFEDFANDEVCPALDPATQSCDLYTARPMTCRVFGPPVRNQEGLGVCALCYQSTSEEEIAACEMVPDPEGVEEKLLDGLRAQGVELTGTTVAYALKTPSRK